MLRSLSNRFKANIIKNMLALAGLFLFFAGVQSASAATNIYYSVGQSTADLQTSSSTVTISSTTGLATFSIAQTGNIGVGDRLTVATGTIYYISGKASSTAWYVITATGTMPEATSSAPVTSIKREYTSLAAAIAGASDANHAATSDLAGGDFVLNLPCYYDSGADTSAVDISGYNTGTTTYVKIYTPTSTTAESNFLQRHQGKWDGGRYNLSVNAGYATALSVDVMYVWLDGLQIDNIADKSEQIKGIRTTSSSAESLHRYSNLIVRASGSGSNSAASIGIYLDGSLNYQVWNNVVYGYYGGIVSDTDTNAVNYVVYNNTAVDNDGYGIDLNGNATPGLYLKNNLSVGNATDYSTSNLDSAANNISSDGTAPGVGSVTSTAVAFIDSLNKDYHLAASSSARNVGIDLSSDPYLPLSVDIDGHARSTTSPMSREWDIGADEGATHVYYSVGQNTSDHKTGTPTVTISSSTGLAVFSAGQTAINMGVGDAITYGVDKCYIVSKVSASAWYCLSATGTLPAATTTGTVTSIAHAYLSLSSAEAGAGDSSHLNQSDLYSANLQLNFPCYYDSGADTATVTVNGWTTGANNIVRIYTPIDTVNEANASQRHQGAWDNGKFRMLISSGDGVVTQDKDVSVDGLQIELTSTAANQLGVSQVSGGSYGTYSISNNIIKGVRAGRYSWGIRSDADAGSVTKIWNNVIYDINDASDYGGGVRIYYGKAPESIAYIYNNTVMGGRTGIYASGNDVYAKNNLVFGSASTGDLAGDYQGSYKASSTNNISADGTSPNAAFRNISVAFADSLNKDFHLAASSSARNIGLDLSADGDLALSSDVDGHTRPAGSSWDIGADEGATAVYYSVGQNTSDHKTGSPTVTVSSTTGLATFSEAQTAANMGVGDVITYNTTEKCYITAKASTTAWYCVTATGTAPTAATGVAVNSIAHAFSSLSGAEASSSDATHLNTSDLASNNLQLNIPCYYDSGPDTAPVVISGYATARSNFIKIYTPTDTNVEANASQRHQGTWHSGKYNLVINNNHGIQVQTGHVWLDGLQDQLISVTSNRMGIYVTGAVGNNSHIRVSNSILRGATSTGDWHMGLDLWQTSGTGVLKFWNNLVYDFRRSSNNNAVGIGIEDSTFTSYIYNNTFYNCGNGIYRWGGTGVLKNNIVQNSASAYTGSFHASSTNNISHDATSPNTALRNKIVAFSDAANDDFHLAIEDASARNAGTDLSADGSLALVNDIDNGGRPSQSLYDIGADEGATAVYYSVGQSTADLQTGTSTVTISSSTGLATFSTAQTGNIGVGDRLTVSTGTIYYISGKSSSTAWYVITATGTRPQATTSAPVTSIKREYTSLSAAEAGATDANHLNTGDLVTANVKLNFPCYYDSAADGTAVSISGYTTSPDNSIRIYTPASTTAEANFSQRHQGKWDDSKYRIEKNLSSAGNDYFVFAQVGNVTIDGLQVKTQFSTTSGAQKIAIYASQDNTVISNNIVKADFTGVTSDPAITSAYGIYAGNYVSGGKSAVFNNIVYGFSYNGMNVFTGIAIIGGSTLSTGYAYNNTIYDNYTGLRHGYLKRVARNNIANGNVIDFSSTDSFNASSSNNISSDGTAPGSSSLTTTTVQFADLANNDFHLAASSTARNAAANLAADAGYAIGTDIDGHVRDGSWDAGADEGATAVYYSVGQNTADHKTGTPTVTISSSTGLAVFSVAQTATNMGVGDAITYGSDKCYITAKASSTGWYCRTATGAMPVATTSATTVSITHAFSALNSAVSGASGASYLNTSNLAAGNYQLNLPCYYDSGTDSTYTTVQSYVTAAPNFIRIYTPHDTVTEVNQSQRHQGKWSDARYNLSVSRNFNGALNVSATHVRIEGLQINNTNTGDVYGLELQPGTAQSEYRIDSNIIRRTTVASTSTGIYFFSQSNNFNSPQRLYASNNLIYDQQMYGLSLRGFVTSVKQIYVHNNTVYNSGVGINASYAANNANVAVSLKNNISYGNTTDYDVSQILGSVTTAYASNISKDATSPNSGSTDCGGHSCRNQAVAFADLMGKDFHLLSDDTSAKDAGTDLSADARYAFNNDNGNITRPSAAAWDIGADEAAKAIYYSVGQNTNDHKTGSPTVTVSSSTGLATFSEAQTAANMGVGDAITYGSDKCYITAKASSTGWYCSTATGTMPVATTSAVVVSIKHAFASLAGSIASSSDSSHLNSADLVTNDYQLNLPCYYDSGADTAQVTIGASYLTAPANYIKIYAPFNTDTEANARQRHSGKWDDTKYKLEVAYTGKQVVEVWNDFVRVEGLQMKAGGSGIFASGGFRLEGSGANTDIRVSRNVIRGNFSGTSSGNSGIWIRTWNSSYKIDNNIIYDFVNGTYDNKGIYFQAGLSYVYNNTVANSYNAYVDSGSNTTIYAINNIAQVTGDGWSGTFDGPSDYNVSNMAADATGANSRNSATVAFVDAVGKDFHLSVIDSVAKNAGTDLSAASGYAITSDVDGIARSSSSSAWDIGADEAARAVYYSVGQSTADLQTGTSTVTIASGTATFSTAQTGNIGVGDRVTIATTTIVYISGKISTTQWSVVTATGTLPAATTSAPVTSIKREYTSLSTAVSGAGDANHASTTDLLASDLTLNLPCYYDSGPDAGNVIVNGYTTGLNNGIRIYTPNNTATESNVSQRHQGVWSDFKFNIYMTLAPLISVNDENVTIDGLQFYFNYSGVNGADILSLSTLGTGKEYVTNNIFKARLVNDLNQAMGAINIGDSDPTYYVYNNLIYDLTNPGNDASGIFINGANPTAYVYNNTIINSDSGLSPATRPNIMLKNNIVQNADIAFMSGYSASSSNNISSDGTAPGSGSLTTTTVQFIDTANKDFHLAASSTARNIGADLSADTYFAFTTDIDGHARQLGKWDIGVDEGATAIYYSVGQNTSDHKTGSPTVTISSSTGLATFDVAQTAINMGVGDVVTYGSDKCYITAKASTTAWYCQTATGTMPVATTSATVASIAHAFSSLNSAATTAYGASYLNSSNLATENYQMNFPCYYDSGPDTTQASFNSWTAGPNNLIKVYTPVSTLTEANQRQRHDGRWDDTKYNMNISATSDYARAILFNKGYIWIDGLQIKVSNNDYGWSAAILINYDSAYSGSEVYVSNNIITESHVTTNNDGFDAINLYYSVGRVWNNLIYDTNLGGFNSNSAIMGYYSHHYIYNNTVYNTTGYGIRSNNGSVLAKNNIVQQSTFSSGTFNASSSNNISSDNSAPGAGSATSTTVQFNDLSNKDFHLAASSTARNRGADLSNDSYLAINADIDGHARGNQGGWDIGADEGAMAVYYSVGQNTNDHKTGTPTVTVSSTTGLAIFDTAQTASNMGVGDVITYNTTEKCYIAGKASTTAWYCATATGTAPVAATNVTVNSIAHAFSSLNAAFTSASSTNYLNTADLAASNYQLNVPCYFDGGADTAMTTVSGWTTAPSNSIRIYTPSNASTEANQSQRHQGRWDNSRFRIEIPDGAHDAAVYVSDISYFRIDGLQIKKTVTNYTAPNGIMVYGTRDGQADISNNIVRFVDTSRYAHSGINYYKGNSPGLQKVSIWNNIIYDVVSASGTGSGINVQQYGVHHIYNNTIVNSGVCYKQGNSASNVTVKNNIAQGCSDGYYTGASFNANSDYNISDLIADAPGANSKNASTVVFVDSPNKDYHLDPNGLVAKNAGADLSADINFSFSSDIDGHTRRAGSWSIGADEPANAVYYSVGQSTADLQTGTSTVTISSTTGLATFSTAQTGNIGVGDRVTVATNTIYYISGKASTSAWYVVTATGTLPEATSSAPVTSIKREYTSLAAAEAGYSDTDHINTYDLVTANFQVNFALYYDSGPDTTNLIISDRTTGPSNYLKIFTPNDTATQANVSQRHGGKWDSNKYSLDVTGSDLTALEVRDSYARIEGLQVRLTSTGSWVQAFRANLINTDSTAYFSSNIVSSGMTNYGAILECAAGNAVAYNNISYDIAGDGGDGFVVNNGASLVAYGNTVNNSYWSFRVAVGGNMVAKNNIAQNCGAGTCFQGSFNASSSNNISSDGTAPGANSLATTTVQFVDAANKDFHLAASSTARNVGSDLSADASFAFATDIDGHSRLGSWDVGADEGATAVYYSVGQNTSDHKTGSPTVTVSSSTGLATFDVAQTATNMGVGDVITYGSDKCYITAKASTTAWYCQTATGTMPVATTSAVVTSIAHAFGALNDALGEADDVNHLNTNDLVAGNVNLNVPCYYDSGSDIYVANATGYNTSASNIIKVYTPHNPVTEVNQSQRHQGVWNNYKYSLVNDGYTAAFEIDISNIIIEGLQIENTRAFTNDGSGQNGVYIWNHNGTNYVIRDSIIRKSNVGGQTDTSGIAFNSYNFYNSTLSIYNNTIIDYPNNGIIISYIDNGHRISIYNNTITSATANRGIYVAGWPSVQAWLNVKNNIIDGAVGNDNYSEDFGENVVYSASNNISSDGYAPGANSLATTTVQFVDTLNGDYHLAVSSTARNVGADLSADSNLAINTDIDGHARGNQGGWDIGADEGAAAVYYSVGQNTNDHKTGSPTVTVSSTTGLATFSAAQTATNMGVGDVITYNTTEKCYITAKASTTAWYCATATGTAPTAATDATVNSIAHVFNGLNNAIQTATTTNYLDSTNLNERNYQLNFATYYDNGSDTAAVTVSNYTTTKTNHIKIYSPVSTISEVNQSQRHQGKWSDSAYKLEVPMGFGMTTALKLISSNIIVDGLQVKMTTSDVNTKIGIDMGGKSLVISNNIIRGDFSGYSGGDPAVIGINTSASGSDNVSVVLNNVVYNLRYASGTNIAGIKLLVGSPYSSNYVYNNTIQGNNIGIYVSYGNHYLKNNISVDNVFDYSLNNGGLKSSSNNISKDSSSPDSSFQNKTVEFNDLGNKDFHLAASSSARNSGTDLGTDANYAFNSDIDGQARRAGSWSIGADEPSNAVYYSIGQSTADLKTGSPTMTIASGTATFSTAQTGNIGVGDRVTYNSSSSVAYISGKASTSVWYVVTATGTMPADITNSTVDSIKREYTSMSSAVTGASDSSHMNTTDMYVANMQLNLPTYYDTSADTAAVAISGYNTAVPNYIKIYTPFSTSAESNINQRHSGKRVSDKYSLAVSSGSSMLTLSSGYYTIEGVQFIYSNAVNGNDAIVMHNLTGGDVYFNRNILVADSLINSSYALCTSGSNLRTKLFAANNYIYGWNHVSSRALNNGGALIYAYNNTFSNNGFSVYNDWGTTYLKNNLSANSRDGYRGTFNAASTNNLSDLASDAPGVNPKNGMRVEFVDASSSDYHLKLSDGSARDAGADLSADTNYAFSTDIDGQARGKGLGWDIGADETGAQIYYSVGQNTNDHKTGSPTVTVSGSTATFSEAQTAPNMGVGDVVTYGSNKCYIAGKLSQTAWSCISATGTLPVATTTAPVGSISHVFSSLYNAEASSSDSSLLNSSDLVEGNYILNLPCYYDSGPDTASVTLGGYTTGVNNYIKIYTPNSVSSEANQSQRHIGKWDDTKFSLASGQYLSAVIYDTTVNNVIIDGLQVYLNDAASDFRSGIRFDPGANSDFTISNSIIKNNPISSSTSRSGISVNSFSSNWTVKLFNNVIYDFSSSTGISFNSHGNTSNNYYAYNNTIHNSAYGMVAFQGTVVAKNNILSACATAASGTFALGTDYNMASNPSIGYTVTGGSNTHDKVSQTIIFLDAANGDFHLSNTDTAARDAGASLADDPYLPFMADIDGQMRPIGGVWDIGADEDGGSTRIRGGVKIDGSVKINKY